MRELRHYTRQLATKGHYVVEVHLHVTGQHRALDASVPDKLLIYEPMGVFYARHEESLDILPHKAEDQFLKFLHKPERFLNFLEDMQLLQQLLNQQLLKIDRFKYGCGQDEDVSAKDEHNWLLKGLCEPLELGSSLPEIVDIFKDPWQLFFKDYDLDKFIDRPDANFEALWNAMLSVCAWDTRIDCLQPAERNVRDVVHMLELEKYQRWIKDNCSDRTVAILNSLLASTEGPPTAEQVLQQKEHIRQQHAKALAAAQAANMPAAGGAGKRRKGPVDPPRKARKTSSATSSAKRKRGAFDHPPHLQMSYLSTPSCHRIESCARSGNGSACARGGSGFACALGGSGSV